LFDSKLRDFKWENRGYKDIDEYFKVMNQICNRDELDVLRLRLESSSLEEIKRDESKWCVGWNSSYSLNKRSVSRWKESEWYKNVDLGCWYYYVSGTERNSVFENDWSCELRKKDILLNKGLWRLVGVNYKTKKMRRVESKENKGNYHYVPEISHYGRNKWESSKFSNVWVRKGTKVYKKDEFRDYVGKTFGLKDWKLDEKMMDFMEEWRRYEERNYKWCFFGTQFLGKEEIFNGPGQYYEVQNVVDEGMWLIKRSVWNQMKKNWKSLDIKNKVEKMEEQMLWLNGELKVKDIEKEIEREVRHRVKRELMVIKNRPLMEKKREKELEKIKRDLFVKYMKGQMNPMEEENYLFSDEYYDQLRKYNKFQRGRKKELMGKMLTKIQKDGLDVSELGSLKGIRKSLKENDCISEKQLWWFIGRLSYDVKIQEDLLSGKMSKNKMFKKFESLLKKG
jgi:hypothetical protein